MKNIKRRMGNSKFRSSKLLKNQYPLYKLKKSLNCCHWMSWMFLEMMKFCTQISAVENNEYIDLSSAGSKEVPKMIEKYQG